MNKEKSESLKRIKRRNIKIRVSMKLSTNCNVEFYFNSNNDYDRGTKKARQERVSRECVGEMVYTREGGGKGEEPG